MSLTNASPSSGTPQPLPRSGPVTQAVDPRAVLAFLDALEGHRDIEMHSLMVVRGGHVVAEGWWSPYSPERKHLLYSLSKSFTSAALGLAQAEGLVHLDDPVVAHLPEVDDGTLDAVMRTVTLRHLAAMASGHTRDTVGEAIARDPHEPVRGFLQIPPEGRPGEVFAYNQPCTYTLAAVVQRRAGLSLVDYLRPRLLDPLGIGDVGWQGWPPGRALGFTGLHARTEDVAKLGLLHLRRGRWGDRRLLPAAWVDEATARQVDNSAEPNPDWRQGYGYQFWRARHGYRGDGAFGQFCVVLPEHDTVVATTAHTEHMQAVLDALWSHLLPGLGRRGDPALEGVLDERLRRLAVPPCSATEPLRDAGPWLAAPFRVGREIAGTRTHSALDRVTVEERAGGLRLRLHEPENELAVEVGRGRWQVSEPRDARGAAVPVAASGGLAGPGTLRVHVRFLETPHRLDVTLSLPERLAVAVWEHVPLGGDRLADVHSP